MEHGRFVMYAGEKYLADSNDASILARGIRGAQDQIRLPEGLVVRDNERDVTLDWQEFLNWYDDEIKQAESLTDDSE